MRVPILDEKLRFPTPERALQHPNGLLAIGGDLSTARLTEAYRNGIFPWFSDGDPILWWSPDPRAVFKLDTLRVPTSLRKFVRQCGWHITLDTVFTQVMTACAEAERPGQDGTWITEEMISAYTELHQQGIAHSIEVWAGDELVGGLYGIAMGRLFFGESMFSARSNGSKVALFTLAAHLKAHGYVLLDSQVPNPHTESLGAITLPRHEFLAVLRQYRDVPPLGEPWRCGAIPLVLA